VRAAEPPARPPQQAAPRRTWLVRACETEAEGEADDRFAPLPSPPPLQPLPAEAAAAAAAARGAGAREPLRPPVPAWGRETEATETQRPQPEANLFRRFEALATGAASPAEAAAASQLPSFFDPLGAEEEEEEEAGAGMWAGAGGGGGARVTLQTAAAAAAAEEYGAPGETQPMSAPEPAPERRAPPPAPPPPPPPPPAAAGGFSMASGRAAPQPPPAALAAAHARFGFVGDGPPAEPPPPPARAPAAMFSTAAGGAVAVSAAALAAAQRSLGGAAEAEAAAPAPAPARAPASVFATAAGRAEAISPAALAAAAAALQAGAAAAAAAAAAPPPAASLFSPPTAGKSLLGGGGGGAAFRPPAARAAFLSPPAGGRGGGRGAFVPPAQRGLITPSPRAPAAAPPGSEPSAAAAPRAPRGPLHDLHSGLRGQRQRAPAFFGPRAPHAGAPGRLAAFPPAVRALAADVTAENAAEAVLPAPDPLGDLGWEMARTLLLKRGALPQLASAVWVRNAWRMVVWKLAALERAFPGAWAAPPLNAVQAFTQLCWRYEREHGGARFPVLRRVAEGDAAASTPMCLLVSGAWPDAPGQLELSDGWYPMRAQLDAVLSAAVRGGRIRVGDKLLVSGARRGGDETAGPPLEVYPHLLLRLGCNGVARAPWHARLGARSPSEPLRLLPLAHVRQRGGAVPAVAVAVARVLAPLTLQTVGEVKTVRSAAAEARAHAAWMAARERCSGAARDAAAAALPRDADAEAAAAAIELEERAALEEAGLWERKTLVLQKLIVQGFAPTRADGGPPGWAGEALVTLFGAGDDFSAELREGAAFVLLNAHTDGRAPPGEPPPLPAEPPPRGMGDKCNGGMLELSARHARWLRAGTVVPLAAQAAAPLAGLYCFYAPRAPLPLGRLAGLPSRGAASYFDSVAVLLHATDVRAEGAGRRRQQHAFFVDASLAAAGEGCSLLALTLSSSHEDGFCPLAPAEAPGQADLSAYAFPVLQLQHIQFRGAAPRRALLAAEAVEASLVVAPPPPPPAAATAALQRGLGAQLGAAAAAARDWAARNRTLLLALRRRAVRLTAEPGAAAAAAAEAAEAAAAAPTPRLSADGSEGWDAAALAALAAAEAGRGAE